VIMNKVFVLLEYNGSALDESGLELAAVAASIVNGDGKIVALAAGAGIEAAAEAYISWFDEIHVWDDERLGIPDGEITASVLTPFIEEEAPDLLLAAHTNNAMDFIPGMSVRLDRSLVTDCLSVATSGDALTVVRPVYGGKVNARMTVAPGAGGWIATVRPGAVQASDDPGRAGTIVRDTVGQAVPLGRRVVRTVAAEGVDVDISQADKLIAVGRGIEDAENLEMIKSLAEALGAEIACSRPVVDKQWLPKSRQVGTSGKSVRPSIYIAIGISGSFQHMGGIKGDPFLVAINKDPRAPIFAQADVGIVGDLFDVVPELIDKISAASG
jgi:electron transfer flavoprotein alpha subunit